VFNSDIADLAGRGVPDGFGVPKISDSGIAALHSAREQHWRTIGPP